MSVNFQCGDGAGLVEYVYDEMAEGAPGVSAHVAGCPACAEEVRALRATREQLRGWTPPEAVLGFQVAAPAVSEPGTVLRPSHWWRQPLPAWAQVAAAVALFSAGAVLGALGGTGLTFDTASPAVSADAAASTPELAPASVRDLAALEDRLRAEMSRRDRAVAPVAAPASARQSDEVLLEQVRALIRESERRQQQELTLRAAELVKDVDAQRRGDLARIERTFGQMEGTTGVQVEQQRQLLNYLMRVSQRQPQ